MLAPIVTPNEPTEENWPRVVSRTQLVDLPVWTGTFSSECKDHRYYEVVEGTLHPEVEHCYFVARNEQGSAIVIQPYFFVDVDLVEGVNARVKALAKWARKRWPRFLRVRTLMVGCLAGEGHLAGDPRCQAMIVQQLLQHLPSEARKNEASLIVWKEFPARYRNVMRCLIDAGYSKLPSLPMTTLVIDYRNFNEYMTKALSRITRKSLRRTFRKTERAGSIKLSIVSDASPFVSELYPLYEQVYERSGHHFERLTPEYVCMLGRAMPDKVKFFIWRKDGHAVAFCMTNGDAIYDEYLGLDYSVALKLHLYHYTFRDIVSWAIAAGYKRYRSTALSYDPKLHLRSELDPLDLYVRHHSPYLNTLLRLILPWLEPARYDKILKRFANYRELWGE